MKTKARANGGLKCGLLVLAGLLGVLMTGSFLLVAESGDAGLFEVYSGKLVLVFALVVAGSPARVEEMVK